MVKFQWSRTIGGKSRVIMRHNTASQSRRSHGRGGGGGGVNITNVLAVLGHVVQILSAILASVVYLTMTMRWRTTSHDIKANHTICVLWSCYNVVRLNLRSYHIAWPSYDLRTTSYRSHDHCTTLKYKAMLPSHYAIIVKPYVIVRLSFDWRTMSYDLPMIQLPTKQS